MDDHTAAREWSRRPDDERFLSLSELKTNAEADRRDCVTKAKSSRELHVVATAGDRLELNGGNKNAGFTPWSFGQFCSVIGAPARYLAGLPAELAANCANEGIRQLTEENGRQAHSLLIRTHPDDPSGKLTLRAITSPSYTRVWDAPIVDQVERFIGQAAGQWATPPSWPGKKKPGGLYRSDRDLFIFQTNGGSIVTDPTLTGTWGRTPGAGDGGDQMYRGFILRNSETGAASISVSTFLFRLVCGNHIIGGLSDVREYRRRHVGSGAADLTAQALRHVAAWMQTPASIEENLIRSLAVYELGKTREETIAALRGKYGLTEGQATGAYDLAEKHEPGNPRAAWTIAQGMTRLSQTGEALHNDARFSLDSLAGAMLARIGRLVAA